MNDYIAIKIKYHIEKDDTTKLEAILTKNKISNIDDIVIDGKTLLMLAALKGSINCVKMLADQTKDIDIGHSCHQDALSKACYEYMTSQIHEKKMKYSEIIRLLIARGSKKNCTLSLSYICGYNQLNDAIKYNQDRKDLIALLIDIGANRHELVSGRPVTTIASINSNKEINEFVRDYKTPITQPLNTPIEPVEQSTIPAEITGPVSPIPSPADPNKEYSESKKKLVQSVELAKLKLEMMILDGKLIEAETTKLNNTIDPDAEFLSAKKKLEQTIALEELKLQLLVIKSKMSEAEMIISRNNLLRVDNEHAH